MCSNDKKGFSVGTLRNSDVTRMLCSGANEDDEITQHGKMIAKQSIYIVQ